MKNKIARAIYNAKKNKKSIKANIRLRKNGRFASVSGVVKDFKVSKDGFPYVVFKGVDGKHEWQTVRLENILSLSDV